MLCTSAQVKEQWPGLTGTSEDDRIAQAMVLVSGEFARYLDRTDEETGQSLLERFEDREEVIEGCDSFITVRGLPIREISEVVEADRPADLDDADPLVEDEDFVVRRKFIERIDSSGHPQDWKRWVRVTYSGGFDPVEDPAEENPLPVPADMQLHAATRARHLAQNWTNLFKDSEQVGTGSVNRVRDELPKMIREYLDKFRPPPIG